MEPNDAKLLGLSAEERVGSTLHSVNPDRGNGSSSVLEVSVHNPPLTSCESFASTLSKIFAFGVFDWYVMCSFITHQCFLFFR